MTSQPRRRRCVSFSDNVVRYDPPSFADDSDDVPSNQTMWYTKPELSAIKKSVGQVLLRRIMKKSKQSSKDDGEDDPELWGLERHNIERAQAKKSAVKMILLAQHFQDMRSCPELLRSLSLQVSKKARDMAADQASRDCYHAHEDEIVEHMVDDCLCDFQLPSSVALGATSCCKRPIAEDHERRVRPRLSAM
eukprot:CAMPEP_0176052564 /NCGR_PEP_ID=MMETSP0120_2-20121206/26135_1 /TAXON_ID=160619 /ORGANISM="Kryptoperidinium foliaceum, Strain CCMP 1326" /LENGTH=191 /DNA_ID=CAMNT_0017386003 /DNA_START=75 /DNA_END=650 /DNA_ORIENTATION=+